MSLARKIIMSALAVALVASTPLLWLLDGPGTGQLVGASVQVALAVVALAWTWIRPSGTAAHDRAVGTGRARARDAGMSITGIRRRHGRGGGSATAENTGDATSHGPGSASVTGIDYS
ncbi:hypothetical protein [Streptomyces sp. Caat 7-52]|uniref:hypothetical protein n=1 Tax=Streptomyces sp. Caat 7-52 TaxID=2949637 RepID=UPI002035665D|nr:hypothetical protein [Streptomyces sp. Caat 7-52]